MLRRALLGMSRSEQIKNLLTRAPVTAGVVDRFVAGETINEVVAVTRKLTGAGLMVSVDHLGEDTGLSGRMPSGWSPSTSACSLG